MSNNKQSSSIEWFAKESWKLRVELEDGKISFGEYANKYYQLKEQAKAMHKEEIIDSLIEGMYKGQEVYFSEHKIKLDGNSSVFCAAIAEQYYNTTFGGEDKQQ